MKRLSILLSALILSLSVYAQNSAVDKLFSKYQGKDGVTTVNIGPELFQVMKAMDVEEFSNEDIPLDKVASVKILTIEDEELNKGVNFYKEIKADLNTDGLVEVMTVQDGNETVRMWMSADEKKVAEFLLIVGGDENVLIHITGSFAMEDLEALAESFDEDLDLDLDL